MKSELMCQCATALRDRLPGWWLSASTARAGRRQQALATLPNGAGALLRTSITKQDVDDRGGAVISLRLRGVAKVASWQPDCLPSSEID